VMLPRGVEEYLEHRRRAATSDSSAVAPRETPEPSQTNRRRREARKEVARLERRLSKLAESEKRLHEEMAEQATDHEALVGLDERLRVVVAEREALEEQWLAAAEAAEE
jgi:ABC transport system ATP-binding/permease protein